jgi:hypothetical protein
MNKSHEAEGQLINSSTFPFLRLFWALSFTCASFMALLLLNAVLPLFTELSWLPKYSRVFRIMCKRGVGF